MDVPGPSIDEATLAFVRAVMESVTQPHPSQESAMNAFSAAFERWYPQSINDIIPTDQATMDVLFAHQFLTLTLPIITVIMTNRDTMILSS